MFNYKERLSNMIKTLHFTSYRFKYRLFTFIFLFIINIFK